MTAPTPTPTPAPVPAEPAAEPIAPPAPVPTPSPPAALHDDPAIAKALEGLSPAQRETLLTTGGRNALAARAQEVRDAKAAAATAAETAKAELAQQIGKALGIVEDDTVDPAKLTEQLTAQTTEAKQARTELAVFRSAAAAGADPGALLDSRTFMSKMADIDPGNATAVAQAITEAVAANPTLAAVAPSRLPAPNPAQGSGGSGPTDAGQLDKADVERLSREGKHAEIEAARRDGRLNTLLGIK